MYNQVNNALDQTVASILGEDIAGDWNLVIADAVGGDNGTLLRWIIDLKFCGDGEVTYPEECDGGANCNSCKCAAGARPDPNNPGACASNSRCRL